ncbi:MAG: hypothetical protein LW709_10515 [Oxalobacteraceae bacterium]|nr:hypothetical protein [Oxalobacteraceae bacterium]
MNTAFNFIAEQAINYEKIRAESGEIAWKSGKNFEYRVRKITIPFFIDKQISGISSQDLLKLNQLLISRGLSSISIAQYFQDVKKIFNHAEIIGATERIPKFPKIKKRSVPRGGFSPAEYRRLVVASRELSRQLDHEKQRNHRYTAGGVYARTNSVPREMEFVIRLMINGFMRPTDIFQIKHKHVKVIKGEFCYLRLELPETKRHIQQIVTLRPAVRVYEALKQNSFVKGYSDDEDYLFLPEITNRATAGRLISMHFNKILNHTDLKIGSKGQSKSMYSLRHTAIMFRLLFGQGIDLLTLARNSRTSVQMIEQFYASELKSEMNVGLLQSRRGGVSISRRYLSVVSKA